MDESALREKVGQLLSEVHRLPPIGKADEGSVAQVGAGYGSTMKRDMAALEDSLDQIQLAVKYLVFDLEATKRENRLLRDLLGDA
ncbi:MAG TPA: hypothetical protein VM243_01805 [Phycisphaerae bacterium]|nr:hypothetical protein [Phycisphaerae bacterium]